MAAPLRVLYVIDSLAPGGAETSLVDMAPELAKNGIELHVLPLGPRLDLAPTLAASSAVLHRGARQGTRRANIARTLTLARALRPHLVHTTLFEADIAGRTAAALARIPSSTSFVSDSYGDAHYGENSTAMLGLAQTVDALTAHLAVRFHAISGAIAASVPPRLGLARAKVEVIPRGRNPLAFPLRSPALRERVRERLGIAQDARVVLAVGRLEPPKGLHHLLAALPSVAEENPTLVTLIAGKEGRSSGYLKEQAGASRLDIRFLGHRTDIAELLSAADVFCFPSEREGFGGVLVEALAVGCPIVASDIPTSVEVLDSPKGPVGILTEVGNPRSLAAGLQASLRSSPAVHELISTGRALFEAKYTTAAVSGRLADFFRAAAQIGESAATSLMTLRMVRLLSRGRSRG